MKKLIFIVMALAVMIAPDIAEAQNQITRPSKSKTEETSGNKPNRQSPAKRNNASRGKADRDNVLNNLINNMVYVEGGTFMMGSDDSDAFVNDKPVHRETVRSFYIGKYEVTQKEWKAVMGNNPSEFIGDNLPVEEVSLNECLEFIRKLNTLTGRKFRLPTEAEWEYAAQGGNRSNGYKYSGSNDIDKVAWYFHNSENMTHNVGTKESNELGLHDMTGNVWEWTSSNWSDDYSKPRDSSRFILRGGSWANVALFCRIACRNNYVATDHFNFLGLRLAL